MRKSKGNARRMGALVKAWRGSGQTLSAFARAHGVSRDKLVYWFRRQGGVPRARRRSTSGGVSFAPVSIAAASMAVPAVELTLPDGFRLAIGSGATPELVAAVIDGLRGC